MLNSGKSVDTCLILNKRGDLALDMQPGGYAFLNFKDRATKWVFIKSTSFPNAFSLRPANNIEMALTFDQKRNAAVVKECKMGQAHAMQFWGVSERDTLFTIMDSSKHLDVDKLPQKVGARAYLTNYGAGYLSSSDDEEVYHDDRNDLQDSFYSPSMAPSRKASASGPRHRIQSYTNKPTNYDYQKPPMRRNQSTASVETNSLLNELLENYNHDRDFSRKLESEFGRAKKQDELKQMSRRRAAVLQSKLDDFTNKKSQEAKYWLQAYRKICGGNPNIKGADVMASLVKKETKIVGAASKKEEEEWRKAEEAQNMTEMVEQAMEAKLHKQNNLNDDQEELAVGFESNAEVVVGLGSVPPAMSSPKQERVVKVNRGRSSTRQSAYKRSDSLESIRSVRSVARSRAMFEDVEDRQSVISGATNPVKYNRRAVKQGISHWKQALNTEWNDERIENASRMGAGA